MSVSKKILLALGGAAVVATGLAGTANAHVVAAGAGACEIYAREYAAVHAPQFGLAGWDTAYRYAYNECLAGGPSFVSASPFSGYAYNGYGYGYGPFSTLGSVLAAPVIAAGNIAGAAVNTGVNIAGAALAAPAAIASGTVAAFTPQTEVEPVVTPTASVTPVVSKNYRGTYETAAFAAPVATASALAVPASMAQSTPEWNAYCAAKYRSFDPDTGMYLAYSGTYRMCN